MGKSAKCWTFIVVLSPIWNNRSESFAIIPRLWALMSWRFIKDLTRFYGFTARKKPSFILQFSNKEKGIRFEFRLDPNFRAKNKVRLNPE